MTEQNPIFEQLQQTRSRFLELVDEIRPDLHRYCARMTGSIADGEDVVQDTLARAYYELSELKELPALRAWLFRIAHNRALDYLRRYERRMSEPLDSAAATLEDDGADPDRAIAHAQAVRAAVSRFLELAPAQRSCVILKDVLEYSLDEIAALLELSIPAVKAALHRGRGRLAELAAQADSPVQRSVSPALVRYAELFNARDWDGVRAMLIDDVKLELVSATRRSGRARVGIYFTNYSKIHDWYMRPAWLDGREVLAVFRSPQDERAAYFVELTLIGEQVASIRDYRHVAYIGRDANMQLARG
jgi:RNA polymerase sigma factor (sigma-70 family)